MLQRLSKKEFYIATVVYHITVIADWVPAIVDSPAMRLVNNCRETYATMLERTVTSCRSHSCVARNNTCHPHNYPRKKDATDVASPR